MRLSSLVKQLDLLGDKIGEPAIVRKFLSVVPRAYSQMACAIETLVDLNTLSVEELIGRLKAAEERYDLDQLACASSSSGKLLLSEEEWFARMKQRNGDGPSSSGGRGRDRAKPRGHGRGRKPPGAQGGGYHGDVGNDKKKVTCWY